MEKRRVIVIGAGSAGMSCALKLAEANVDYLIITDKLGGRIHYSEEEKVNFGAYFIMQSYLNAKKLVIRETWINPLSVLFNNSDTDYFPTLSFRTLSMSFQLLKFARLMIQFMRHYAKFKNNCEVMTQTEAMNADPYIKDYFFKSASDFIRENKIEKIAGQMISKFSYACTGVPMEKITTLDFMNVCQGLVIPIHRFKFDQKALEQKFSGHLDYDTVARLSSVNGQYEIETNSGKSYQAEFVVAATPAAVTKVLLDSKDPLRQTCKLYTFHVKAEWMDKFNKYQMNLFPFESEIIFTAVQDDGTYLIYTREEKADLRQVCIRYELISMVAWDKAMYVYGDAYLEQKFADNLYIAGDHNGLGLEPTAISGIYAANQIIKALRK
jgi:hypothetical protein